MNIPNLSTARHRDAALTVLNDPSDQERSPEDRLTEVELASQYNLKKKSLQKWRWLGRGPAFERLGRKILYRRGDIEAWLQSHRVEPKSGGQ